eukprot:CAMPEP_0184432390 /NCGR_PEP_ID=MMETSP0738-20130409/345977_1 /TAXON_ID=385413 /ORGANISM="Thalassiosira miniscula, Strain CCMP1093" /LENGTH=48 /DNA_ID= /DNA_START= /DNA_END= /DNA_ORIENTATION=
MALSPLLPPLLSSLINSVTTASPTKSIKGCSAAAFVMLSVIAFPVQSA